MEQAKWIWYYEDFEIFHSAKLHSLREEHGTIFPGFWSLANVYPIVRFILVWHTIKQTQISRLLLRIRGK